MLIFLWRAGTQGYPLRIFLLELIGLQSQACSNIKLFKPQYLSAQNKIYTFRQICSTSIMPKRVAFRESRTFREECRGVGKPQIHAFLYSLKSLFTAWRFVPRVTATIQDRFTRVCSFLYQATKPIFSAENGLTFGFKLDYL